MVDRNRRRALRNGDHIPFMGELAFPKLNMARLRLSGGYVSLRSHTLLRVGVQHVSRCPLPFAMSPRRLADQGVDKAPDDAEPGIRAAMAK